MFSDRVASETSTGSIGKWFNASRAAVMLGVHERTISYRLRSIESKLGADVATRRDELGVALRLLAVVRTIGGPSGVVAPAGSHDLSPS